MNKIIQHSILSLVLLAMMNTSFAAYPISVTNGYLSATKLADMAQLNNFKQSETDGSENDYANIFFTKLTTNLPGATSQSISQGFAQLANDSINYFANGNSTEVLEEAVKDIQAMKEFRHLNFDEAAYTFILTNELLNN